MSEDRLDKALEAMKNESITPEETAAARTRVWEKLNIPAASACAEFQPRLQDYLDGRLAANRRLLMEDHLGRCPECRRELGALKGEGSIVQMPALRTHRWPMWRTWALLAAMLVVAIYVGRQRIDAWLAPGGPRATVALVSGGLYRLPEGVLQAGAAIGEREVVRTGPASRAVLRLADGSLVEVNERSELYVRAAWSGQTVYLERGDIIVQAAKQHRGHLRVQTHDSLASVKGTVFAVSAGFAGSVVSVIEGAVEVEQPGTDRVLRPGEQAASNSAVRTMSVSDAVAWSPDAEKYLALLGDFAKIEKQLASLPPPALRTQPRLLPFLPANAVVYGAVPNLTGTIQQALALAEQQASESQTFREWWNSSSGQELKTLVDHLRSVTPLLGEEIAYVICKTAPDSTEDVHMMFAEVQPGKREVLKAALEALRPANATMAYFVNESLMIVSDSDAHLQWLLAHLGQGAATPFAAELARRYQRGVGWLLSMDMAPAFAGVMKPGDPAKDLLTGKMKHLFLEQRSAQGAEENEISVTFNGPRTGFASWLAGSGSGGAASYISSEALAAFSASTRDPRQLYDEITAQLAKLDSNFVPKMQEAEAKLGVNFADEIVSSLGTDFAITLDGPLVPTPAWVAIALVYKPSVLDGAIRKLIDVANSEITDPANRVSFTQEVANGRTWSVLRRSGSKTPLLWTYDNGYMVLAADRTFAERAIATHNGGGFPLIFSPAFQQQLPSSTGLHPSGFAWLNTKGALAGLASVYPNPILEKLASDRDPVLIILNGETEQIRAASRTRLTSLVFDLLMFGQAQAGTQGTTTMREQKPRTGS